MSEYRFARRMEGVSGNIIREILKLTQQKEVISFAGGLPSPDTFPVKPLTEIAAKVMRDGGQEMLQYGTSEGHAPLRSWLAESVSDLGIDAQPDEVLITTGSQQGLDLVAKAFLNPGDKVVVERPTYLASIQIFKSYEAEFLTVPTDEYGMDIDALKAALQAHEVKLVYLVPNFQNPSGITLARERRSRLAKLAEQYNAVVVEDDPYGALRYQGEALPAIKHYDEAGRIVYLGSFSKVVSPGLRVGYAIAAQPLLRKMVIGKQGSDVHTSNLCQYMVYEFCRQGLLAPHIAEIQKQYGAKRETMLQALAKSFPLESKWTHPEGGLFIWATLREDVSTTQLLEGAVAEQKVAFIPGTPFFVDGSGDNTMRLNFSNASHEAIEDGIARLGTFIKENT